jgi:phenylacetate-CoA ligase
VTGWPAAAETLPWEEQRAADEPAYRAQLAHLLANSPFYRDRLTGAGITAPEDAGGLADIGDLPLSGKADIRETFTAENPFGAHLAVGPEEIARIYSTSGTTGAPSFIPLTKRDIENWVTVSERSYAATGTPAGARILTTYNSGPWVAGAALIAFENIGLCHVPVGTGNAERLMLSVDHMKPDTIVLTPSYAGYLIEWAAARGKDLRSSSVNRIIVAGEPGGGEPAYRAMLEEGWGARVTEVMGIGDIGVSLWGECPEQDGMHFAARGLVHPELIDPASGAAIPMEDGATGELVLTHLHQRAAPHLRFRTRDHILVRMTPCACGRTGPRIRCIGRTDDMVIVRGVNVFPSAVREVVAQFAPRVSGHILVRPTEPGVKQEPPLPVSVELAPGAEPDDALAEAIKARIRNVLVVTTEVELVPYETLARTDAKAKLVERAV